MNLEKDPPLDAAGARIVDRLHNSIASLVGGNHVARTEVLNVGGRSCPCYLNYEVEWSFVSHTSEHRVQGNSAVNTHFGYARADYDTETEQRCEIGRTHQPIRQNFMAQVLEQGGAALADAGSRRDIWDFGQHSVHAQCGLCRGNGEVTCHACNGNGKNRCSRCSGVGSTTETRTVGPMHNGQQRQETYQQTCYGCGGSGNTSCSSCNGRGTAQCGSCAGNGFFTDITSVTVQAKPKVHISAQSALSQDALLDYLVQLPVSQVVDYLDFTQTKHQETANGTWCVAYETHTTVAELDVRLRSKTYLAAAISDKALPFLKPVVFDDIFVEELADLQHIGGRKKRTFSNRRARQFFATYAGQPVLDKAMQAIAKLHEYDRKNPGNQVVKACDGYISTHMAHLLGDCMVALIDKVSPPNSHWSWIAVMALPFLILFLGAQNLLERHVPEGLFNPLFMGVMLVTIALVFSTLLSPLAALLSTIVSAIRRRAVPAEYRQHGRNWQPFKLFTKVAVGVVLLGDGMGIVTHYNQLPRWNNKPVTLLEKTLHLHQFSTYTLVAAWVRKVGFFRAAPPAMPDIPSANLVVFDIQHNLQQLGYHFPVTGLVDDATQNALFNYVEKTSRINKTDYPSILASLCKDLPGECSQLSKNKVDVKAQTKAPKKTKNKAP